MSLSSIGIMLNSQILAVYLKILMVVEILTPLELDNNIVGVVTQSFNQKYRFSMVCA